MTRADDETTAGRGRLRTSHADREHAIGVLKTAFVQGRLTKNEFDVRVGQAFTSRTYAELALATVELPAGLIPAPPPPKPAQAQAPSPARSAVKMAASTIATGTVLTAILWVATFLSAGGGVARLAFYMTLADFVLFPLVVSVLAAQALETWRQGRSGRRPPPAASGHGGKGPRRVAPARTAGPSPRATDNQRHIAQARRQPSPAWS